MTTEARARPTSSRGGAGQLLLAFDTSADLGSVGLFRGRSLLARRLLVRRGEHASRLVPAIGEILEEAAVDRTALEGIVVGKGPGSFTGVRVAAATARGLAAGLEVPVWAWSSLAAAAASWGVSLPSSVVAALETEGSAVDLPDEAQGRPRYVLLDARGRRVYAACYRLRPDRMDELAAPHATTVDQVMASNLPPNALFCGDGALRHREDLEGEGHLVVPLPTGLPTAEGLLRVHLLHPEAPPLDPASRWQPEYLRDSSARPMVPRMASISGPSGGPR